MKRPSTGTTPRRLPSPRQFRASTEPGAGHPTGGGDVAAGGDLRTVPQSQLQCGLGGGLGAAVPLDGADPTVIVPGQGPCPKATVGAVAADGARGAQG